MMSYYQNYNIFSKKMHFLSEYFVINSIQYFYTKSYDLRTALQSPCDGYMLMCIPSLISLCASTSNEIFGHFQWLSIELKF